MKFFKKIIFAGVLCFAGLSCSVFVSCDLISALSGSGSDSGSVTPAVTVKQVTFSPDGGKVRVGDTVTLSCKTKDVEIWYCPSTLKKAFYPTNYSKFGTKGDVYTFTKEDAEEEAFILYAIAVDKDGNTSKRSQAEFTVIDGIDFDSLLCMAKRDENNKFSYHSVELNGEETLTYCLEYDTKMKHSTWVGFYWDSELIKEKSGVVRYDNSSDEIIANKDLAFCEDPNILGSEGGVVPYDHKSDGFDRGHLCSSQDRFYDQDANRQTFYLTNMSPQEHEFNANFWGSGIEARTRTLAGKALTSGYEKVYVIKGGDLQHLLKNYKKSTTAADGQYPATDANGYSVKGLPVPAYYYTVLLAEKSDGTYITLGFYVPHAEEAMTDEEKIKYSGVSLTSKPNLKNTQKFVYPIDYIEERTGIDFFCNLPDEIEDEVEARSAADCISAWEWY